MSQPFHLNDDEEQLKKLEMTLKKKGHLRGGRGANQEALNMLMGAYSDKAANDLKFEVVIAASGTKYTMYVYG